MAGDSVTLSGAERRLRRDAAANQERLLEAAVTAIRRHGDQVPLAAIAQQAGVGIGTLYRRYSNRDALMADLELRSFELVSGALEAELSREANGLDLIAGFLDRTIAHGDRLVLPLHGAPSMAEEPLVVARRRVRALAAEMIARGHTDGSVSTDVSSGEVILFGAMIAQPLPSVDDWPRAARTQAAIFLRGISAAPNGRLADEWQGCSQAIRP